MILLRKFRGRSPKRGLAPLTGFLLVTCLAGCTGSDAPDRSKVREQAAPNPAEPKALAATESEPVLRVDRSTDGATVTHLESGRDFQIFADEGVEGSDEEGTFHQLLSSFGAYVSYSTEWYYEDGAHPSYGQTYTAVEIVESAETANLRDLFDDEVIRSALAAAPIAAEFRVRGAEGETLDALLEALADGSGCEADFGSFFSSFFVKEATNGTALVDIGLSHDCEAARGNFTVIELKMQYKPKAAKLFRDLRTYTEPT